MISILVPISYSGNSIFIGLAADDPLNANTVDALVVRLNTESQDISEPWSVQKLLKFHGYYEDIDIDDRADWLKKISDNFTEEDIGWIVDALTNPTQKSVESLIWIPERLKNKDHRHEYLRSLYSNAEYNQLKQNHGSHGSWAIWDENDPADSAVIDKHWTELHCRYVLIGLNISKPLNDQAWCNFHGGKHDRKLVMACNSSMLRGSYMTDLFKGIDTKSSQELLELLRGGNVDIAEHLRLFKEEMNDVKVNADTIFVLLGDTAFNCYNEYYRNYFPNWVIKTRHYSDYSKGDDDWVREFRDNLFKAKPR